MNTQFDLYASNLPYMVAALFDRIYQAAVEMVETRGEPPPTFLFFTVDHKRQLILDADVMGADFINEPGLKNKRRANKLLQKHGSGPNQIAMLVTTAWVQAFRQAPSEEQIEAVREHLNAQEADEAIIFTMCASGVLYLASALIKNRKLDYTATLGPLTFPAGGMDVDGVLRTDIAQQAIQARPETHH